MPGRKRETAAQTKGPSVVFCDIGNIIGPTRYRGLFSDPRDALTGAAEEARGAGRGVFGVDKTNEGFRATNLSSITRRHVILHVILPRLFRRLSEYIVNSGTAVGFKEKLEESRGPVLDLRTANFTHFDAFVGRVDGGDDVRLTRRPEELVFDEMSTRPSGHFSLLMMRSEEAVSGEARPSRAGGRC